jgi:cell division initiation protein
VRISPLDIRKQSFKSKMRGADPEEVRIFLDVVASEYEQVLQENAMLAERLRSYEARLAEYQKMEANMRDSLVTVERIASESRDSSEQTARRLVQDAHSRSERILEDARERLQALIREIEMLRGKKEVFARRFWTLIEGQIGVLQEHMTDTVEVDTLRQKIARMAADARDAAAADFVPPPMPLPSAESLAPEGSRRPEAPRTPEEPAPGLRGPEPRGDDLRSYDIRSMDHGLVEPSPEPRSVEDWAPRHEAPQSAARPAPTPGGVWNRPVPGPEPARHAEDWPQDAGREAGQDRGPITPIDGADEVPMRRVVPKGLRSLLRGRQAQLPLGERVPPATEPVVPVAPSMERREGVFELRAGEVSRDGTAARSGGGNGSDRP